MCGRFSFDLPVELLERYFDLVEVRGEPPRSYNVAPTEDGPVVLDEGEGRALDAYRWGLVPPWADDPGVGGRAVNARAETLGERPTFREAFRGRRCVVPVSGFYEWQDRPGGGKVPHHVRPVEGGPLPLAGLWERWDPGGRDLRTFTIVTTDANETVRPLHDRMPVVLEGEGVDRWLDPGLGEPGELGDLLRPARGDRLEAVEVGERVSDPSAEGPDLVEPREDGGQGSRLEDFGA